MNQGAMNVASKIPGMARAAGRMVGTAGRKFGEAAQTAREIMTSPEAKDFAATTREGAGQVMRGVGKVAMGTGRHAGNVAGAATTAGTEYGVKGARALGRGGMNVASKIPGMMGAAGRLLMGTNNPMANQPSQNQPSQSRSAPFGNNKTSESEGQGQPQQAAPSGYTPNQGMLDNLYQQNIDRSQTRGGVGTGIVSNLLTGGLSGLARGAYNMRQRNIGRQNLQNLNQYGGGAVPFLRSEYETMRDRTIIRSRMTTEAIRSAYVV
jgi:Sec-independent protein translocase protein TatA